jgi:hypothetical protein
LEKVSGEAGRMTVVTGGNRALPLSSPKTATAWWWEVAIAPDDPHRAQAR